MTLEETLRWMVQDRTMSREAQEVCGHAADRVKEAMWSRGELARLNAELAELRALRAAIQLVGKTMLENGKLESWLVPQPAIR